MEMKIHSFKDLRVWQKGIEIVDDVYKVTKDFPREEKYALVSQMRRSAVSIPSNIAEGFKRYHNKEYRKFLYVAMGSSAELETQLIISQRQSYISDQKLQTISEKINHFSRMTSVLIKKIT